MFGNILIDKLRISVKITQGFACKEAKVKLDFVMSEHFRDNNYTINYSKTYFRVTFTPTLYLESVDEYEDKPIHNLEMISEEKLLRLLNDIYGVLGDSAVVTWIDLTKNILLEGNTREYIDVISKRKIKYPYKKHPITSKIQNTTLTLSPLKRSNTVECKNMNRIITFYDKIQEIKSKSNVRFLDNVRLSKEEIEQLQVNYNPEAGRLFLKGLNILRCEQRYKFTNNIMRITQLLTDSKSSKELTLALIIELLKRNELYRKLDEFYTKELREYIFYENTHGNKEVKLNKQEERIATLVNKYNIDISDYQQLFYDIGYNEHFNRFARKIHSCTTGEYYKTLYIKFGI